MAQFGISEFVAGHHFLLPSFAFAAVLLTFLVTLLTYWRRPLSSPLAQLDGPPSKHWFFGFLDRVEAASFQLSPKLLELCAKYDGVWFAQFTNRRPTLVLGDPVAVKYVLNNPQTYTRAEAQMRVTRLVFGDGLVGVDGAQHKRQRRVVGPAFTATAVEGMAHIFYNMAEKLASRWERRLQWDERITPQETIFETPLQLEINAYHEFECLSLDIIGLSGFQYDFKSLDGQRSQLESAFVNVTQSAATGSVYSALRSQFPWVEKLGHYLSSEQKELDRHKRNIRAISKQLVQDAKDNLTREVALGKAAADEKLDNTPTSRNRDILSLLIQANTMADATDRIPEEEIISMIPTFLSGGYDNNASEMSYAVYGLATWPQVQHRLREELRNPPAGCEEWRADLKALDKLPYLDAVMRETLRLYSSAHSIPRTCAKDDTVPLSKPIQLRDGSWTDRIIIGKNDDVVIAQKFMNINPSVWGPDAHIFKPERWIQDRKHKYYERDLPASVVEETSGGWSHLMTFSIGPRNCIGYRMALAEFKVGLAVLVDRFEFIRHEGMDNVFGEVQIVDRPRVKGVDGYSMPCWVRLAYGPGPEVSEQQRKFWNKKVEL